MFTFRVITWQGKGGASVLALASGFFPPEEPRNNPPWAAGASGDTHPLVVTDRELHCELRLGLKERKGREEGRIGEMR